ncbi:5696_t:CDS:2 [Entrophospora sp. SA101]|nr:5696_t:CDS:2 [Entrophospora sp. SA101]
MAPEFEPHKLCLETLICEHVYQILYLGRFLIFFDLKILWAHRAYKASRPLEIFLLFGASGAVEGSVRWWCRDHRAHHRYTDTEKDPYSAHKGLLYSHIGWMLLKQNPNTIGKADISDLNSDPLLRFQHRNFLYFALGMGFLLPTLGGFYFAAVLRLVVVHHATFCVNSLAHFLGDAPFDDRRTPRDHFLTAIFTLGEGYHNFHHEFPMDYRNAIKFYQYDPTKWLIRFLSYFKLTHHLKKFPDNEIKKGILLMKQKKLDDAKKLLYWGVPLNQLPVYTFDEFKEHAQNNNWILIEGIIYDVTNFIEEHPGGRSLITTSIGKDMTTAFNGGVYDHSNAARNLTSNFRVGVIAGGGEVESHEYLNRPTLLASWWNPNILSGLDLQRSDKGTWLGISRNGRFAAITNYQERLREKMPLSRGLVVKKILESSDDNSNSNGNNKSLEQCMSELSLEIDKYGGLNLFTVDLKDSIKAFYLNNRENVEIRQLEKGMVYGLSNTILEKPWPKVNYGIEKLKFILKEVDEQDEDELVKRLFELLSTVTPSQEPIDENIKYLADLLHLRYTIRVPKYDVDGPYATRTSTIILVDYDNNVLFIEKNLFDEEGKVIEDENSGTKYRFKIDGDDDDGSSVSKVVIGVGDDDNCNKDIENDIKIVNIFSTEDNITNDLLID